MPRRLHVRHRPRPGTRAAAGLLAILALWVAPGAAAPRPADPPAPSQAPLAPPAKAAPATVRGELLWPLERTPREIVSAFGEYRYDHLHAGLDLSTGGAVGLPVRALGDGEVVRLKVEWRGYGRALYLRLRDGRRIVYGHLERYEEKTLGLEARVER